MQPISTHGGEVMYFVCVYLRVELGFLNGDDNCICIVNNQFELLKFVFDSAYDEIYHTCTAGSVSLCYVCSDAVVFGLSVRLLWYPMWMRWL